jgi:hypothetical protein
MSPKLILFLEVTGEFIPELVESSRREPNADTASDQK